MTQKNFSSASLLICFLLFVPFYTQAGQKAAYGHLNNVMDRFQRSFDVFTDLSAAGNHFAARCAVVRNPNNPADLSGVSFDEGQATGCRSGATCIKNTFSVVDPAYWGGWYFQNGVLLSNDTQPRCNWGDYAEAGFNLEGATTITFWARGEQGGEQIEFFAGGIGRQPCGQAAIKPYPDSFPRVPACGQAVTLTTGWQQYVIDLTGENLRYVVGGFGWVASATNNPSGATFYLDDIRYDKRRPNALRFLRSYEVLPLPPGPDFDTDGTSPLLMTMRWFSSLI